MIFMSLKILEKMYAFMPKKISTFALKTIKYDNIECDENCITCFIICSKYKLIFNDIISFIFTVSILKIAF